MLVGEHRHWTLSRREDSRMVPKTIGPLLVNLNMASLVLLGNLEIDLFVLTFYFVRFSKKKNEDVQGRAWKNEGLWRFESGLTH